jgi:ribulose 1,5-bisphosphate synthetase/thiazole synthase
MRHRELLLLTGLIICSLCTVTHAVDLHYYRQAETGKPKLIECDVVVYGGTPAGVTAAIQAARAGKKVALLSFNQHVGGMTSGGLTATDVGNRNAIGGLAWGVKNLVLH